MSHDLGGRRGGRGEGRGSARDHRGPPRYASDRPRARRAPTGIGYESASLHDVPGMRLRHILSTALLIVGCHGSDPANAAGSGASSPTTTPSAKPVAAGSSSATQVADASKPAPPAKPPVPVVEK